MSFNFINTLADIRIILVRTSHPGNVGQAARAMANMGLNELYITSPRFNDICAQPDAIALASGATAILNDAVIVDDLASALRGVNFAYAFSARTRDLAPPLINSGEAAAEVMAMFQKATSENIANPKIAFVFGAERSGLVNDEVMLCQKLCQIEANPTYNSLNLAQAVQVMAYSLRQAALHNRASQLKQPQNLMIDLCDLEKQNGMLQHWQQMLTHLKLIDAATPTEAMNRLKALFARTQLSENEVNFLRGIANAVLKNK